MKKLIISITALAIFAAAIFSPVHAQMKRAVREGDADFQLPDEVKRFVEAGKKTIAYAKADLTGDGEPDYILVLEELKGTPQKPGDEMSLRPTLIIVRHKDELNLVGYNDSVVFCRGCIGGMSDSFEGIEITRNGFSITNRGGSRDRWVGRYEFKFSHRDQTFQLARVVEANYESLKPKPVWSKTYTVPKHFGKINFSDFEPENFQGRGEPALPRAQTREVSIYLHRMVEDEKTGIPKRYLLEVKRRVDARAPLEGALRALLGGATNEETKRGMHSFIYGVELESVRIKNKAARVDFTFNRRTNSWLDPTMEAFFNEAVERTAKQFAGVKRVLVCVDGIENFFLSERFHRKCPKK